MKKRETLKLVAGSVTVYIVVACGSAVGPGLEGATADGSRDASSGVPSDATSSSPNDTGLSVIDALTDPVSTAKADPNQSGTRLKAKYYVGTDGSKTFAGMHDGQLGVDCAFTLASDGTTRCLPGYGTGAALANEPYFADSGCTQPLGFSYSGCPSPTYATGSISSSCQYAPEERIFAVTGVVTGTAYQGTPSSCTAFQASALTTVAFYSLGAEVPPSTFVQGTVQTDP
jgi:hypothetical protein